MSAIGDATRRGYTDHTMLDNLGLVHMNGRVFDPAIGRFMSADPFIDCFMDTQGWNRYSYVKNMPMSRVDPTGYWGEDFGPSTRRRQQVVVIQGRRLPFGSGQTFGLFGGSGQTTGEPTPSSVSRIDPAANDERNGIRQDENGIWEVPIVTSPYQPATVSGPSMSLMDFGPHLAQYGFELCMGRCIKDLQPFIDAAGAAGGAAGSCAAAGVIVAGVCAAGAVGVSLLQNEIDEGYASGTPAADASVAGLAGMVQNNAEMFNASGRPGLGTIAGGAVGQSAGGDGFAGGLRGQVVGDAATAALTGANVLTALRQGGLGFVIGFGAARAIAEGYCRAKC
jgi:RHS repeat-associated protein